MNSISNKALKKCVSYFKIVDQLQILIFTMIAKRNYFSQPYAYETQTHKIRAKLMRQMKVIRDYTNVEIILAKLENIYEIIFSLNTLKLRFADQTTFEVCEAECKEISIKLSAVLQNFRVFLQKQSSKEKIAIQKTTTQAAKKTLDQTARAIGELTRAIASMDELYRTTLQVVSPEPILFLFFIQDLVALRDLLESFVLRILNE